MVLRNTTHRLFNILGILVLCISMGFFTAKTQKIRKFPSNFKFSAAGSSYQIEGAWNLNGKGESIWDRAVHTPGLILDGSTGDVACDSYHKYEEDIRLLKQLKVDCYRFSISWTRLFPHGTVNVLNPDGVKYYNNLINALLKNGIRPMVTLFHWDTPQTLEDLGGWASDSMVIWFLEYADKVFGLFGDRVKVWTTLNEPANYCNFGYTMISAPFLNNSGIGTYLCTHNMLRGHAKAYRLYERKYKKMQKGIVGITLDSFWNEPKNPSSKLDQEAAQAAMESYFGWYTWPIFKTGDYPESMRTRIDKRSRDQGFAHSRLPKFTRSEKEALLGSADYLGLNHYSTLLATFANQPVSKVPSYANDRDISETVDPSWTPTARDSFSVTPRGLYKLLLWIGKEFGNNVTIAITENGYDGAPNESFNDSERVNYMNLYLEAVLEAMSEGANVTGYTWWSLLDNFEWAVGYTNKFGLYKVDFNDPNRTRTAKKSAMVYQNIIVTRKIDKTFDPIDFAH